MRVVIITRQPKITGAWMKDFLTVLGLENVSVVGGIEEARSKISETVNIDLVLVDAVWYDESMKKLSGNSAEFVNFLRNIFPNSKVVGMTSLGSVLVEWSKHSGADHVLHKGVDIRKDMEELMNSLMRQ